MADNEGSKGRFKQARGRRLYTRAVHLGYKRSMRKQYPNHSLLKIEGVHDRDATTFYHGKRVAYVYRSKNLNKNGTNVRVVWGKITRAHGNSGVVRATFTRNLPPKTFGATVRVMLYPSSI